MANPDKNYRTAREYFGITLRGLGMGVADLIPGISGGTIAFISGIYEDLIAAIRTFDENLLKLILRGRWREACEQASWKFLGSLFAGIFTSIFVLSRLVAWLIANKPVYLNAFFFGLIVATVPIIGGQIRSRSSANMVLAVISAILTYLFVGLVPVTTPETPGFIFVCGAIAICAMILPGISGSFILVLLSKYEFLIHAASHRELAVLGIFAAGCAFGILTFVRVLQWLFSRFHDVTLAVLTGLVIGSLRKVWPWKETIRSILHKGKIVPVEQINYWPQSITAEVLIAGILVIAGFWLAMYLGRLSPRHGQGIRLSGS